MYLKVSLTFGQPYFLNFIEIIVIDYEGGALSFADTGSETCNLLSEFLFWGNFGPPNSIFVTDDHIIVILFAINLDRGGRKRVSLELFDHTSHVNELRGMKFA
jgi:hypothetical protein